MTDLTRRALAGLALSSALAGVAARAASAAAPSPVGLWRYTDHDTGRTKADIRITETNGELRGVIEKPYPQPGDPPDRVCEKCPGDLKGKPFQNLPILWGFHQDGASWGGGHIIDAETGTTYKCTLTPSADDKTMKVRGYVGISLFGRTETWARIQ